MDTTTKLVKGALLENTVAYVKAKLGDDGVSKLESKLGSLLFDQFHMYPLDQYQSLQKEAVELISPNDPQSEYKKMGKQAFTMFASTIVGATLTNVSTTPKNLLEKIQELWNMVVNFGERKLIECNEEAKFAVVEIIDDPREPAFLQGVIEGSLESLGLKSESVVENQTANKYTIKITW